MKVKLSKAMVVLLFILIAVAACGREPPFCNQPTIEGPYDFHIRYFNRGFSSPSGYLEGGRGRADFYAAEREWLQEHPEELNRRWRWSGFCPENRHWTVSRIRVVTSVEGLAEPNLVEYTDYFFESNYLVVIDLTMPHSTLDELVHHIAADGTIQFRPLVIWGGALTGETHWTVIIELDNRFRPPGFSIVFIDNPWAPECQADGL